MRPAPGSRLRSTPAALAGALVCVLCWVAAPEVWAQDDVYVPDHPLLVLRTASATPSGSTTLTARCRDGELLIGGGYRAARPALDDPVYPSLEASYPSGPRSWTVVAFVPPGSAVPRVTALAYCLTRPIASVQFVQSPVVQAVRDASTHGLFLVSTTDATCPSGSVLTAGGFRTTHTQPGAGLHNAFIFASMPMVRDGRATGWRVVVRGIERHPAPFPSTRTYAVCASPRHPLAGQAMRAHMLARGEEEEAGEEGVELEDEDVAVEERRAPRALQGGLAAGAVRSFEVPASTRFGYTHHEGRGACPGDEVTVGGGYEFRGDALVPHNVFQTVAVGATAEPPRLAPLTRSPEVEERSPLARPFVVAGTRPKQFGGWGLGAIFGDQLAAQQVIGHVPCIRLPVIPLTVKIIDPNDGSSPALEFRDGRFTGRTQPIGFRAIAGDAHGNYVSGAAYAWTVDGQALGSTESFSAALPAQHCTIETRTVRVTARDAQGHTASAAVRIRVGTIC